jgi:uncharacterized protein
MNLTLHHSKSDALRSSEQGSLGARLWMIAGWLCLVTGIIGIVVPLLPTTDFVLMAAYCFSRGSRRWETWLLGHPRFGPIVREWRATRAVPLRAKWGASAMMAVSCSFAAWVLPARTGWIPAVVCLLVAFYLWSRPSQA